jgi:hypothetical protein
VGDGRGLDPAGHAQLGQDVRHVPLAVLRLMESSAAIRPRPRLGRRLTPPRETCALVAIRA